MSRKGKARRSRAEARRLKEGSAPPEDARERKREELARDLYLGRRATLEEIREAIAKIPHTGIREDAERRLADIEGEP